MQLGNLKYLGPKLLETQMTGVCKAADSGAQFIKGQ